jgi:hypothetical protein
MKPESLSNRTLQRASGSAIAAALVAGAISYRGMAVSGESKAKLWQQRQSG